jgi:hypothetical protein
MHHNHEFTKDLFIITEMQIMWFLMVIMFLWHSFMQYQHLKLKNKVSCNCKKNISLLEEGI